MDNIVAIPSIASPNQGAANTTYTPNPYLDLPQSKEAPFSLFQRDNQMPYSAKFFGVDYKTLHQIEPDGIASKVQAIDDYVLGKINEGAFDSTKTYEQIINDIKEVLGIKEFEPTYQQVEKIHSFVSINSKRSVEPRVNKNSQAERIDQLKQDKMNPANKEIQFNKRLDSQINKHITQYIKTLDGQFKKIDQTLYKRVDDQLKKIGQFQKVSKSIDRLLKIR